MNNHLKPLLLGNTRFENNLIQGPLAGVSCAPFRYLTWQYSKPAFSCSEMISCKTLNHQPAFMQKRYVYKDPNEGPVCFQLSANNLQELAEAVQRATAYGADLIDLNCGCPVKKIRSRGAGSALLTQPSLIYQLIRTMKQNTHLPISIKIRVEHPNEKFNHDLAKAINDAQADFLIVHGRHWTEHYETPCRHDQIAFFVNEMSMPVIGNGDIHCIESLKCMFETGCAGIMIARAGVGQPWLIAKLIAELQGNKFKPPTTQEIGQIFVEHVTRLISLLDNEKFAILQARKLAKYYARPIQNRTAFCEKLNECQDMNTLTQLVFNYF